MESMVDHRWQELVYQGLLATLHEDVRRGHFQPGGRLKVADLSSDTGGA
jgi:hypothetical protein